jgi:hypothetical protein
MDDDGPQRDKDAAHDAIQTLPAYGDACACN